MTLYNNFWLKRGVGLFSRVGLFSGDYGIRDRKTHTWNRLPYRLYSDTGEGISSIILRICLCVFSSSGKTR